jgi:hypothetical protein
MEMSEQEGYRSMIGWVSWDKLTLKMMKENHLQCSIGCYVILISVTMIHQVWDQVCRK